METTFFTARIRRMPRGTARTSRRMTRRLIRSGSGIGPVCFCLPTFQAYSDLINVPRLENWLTILPGYSLRPVYGLPWLQAYCTNRVNVPRLEGWLNISTGCSLWPLNEHSKHSRSKAVVRRQPYYLPAVRLPAGVLAESTFWSRAPEEQQGCRIADPVPFAEKSARMCVPYFAAHRVASAVEAILSPLPRGVR